MLRNVVRATTIYLERGTLHAAHLRDPFARVYTGRMRNPFRKTPMQTLETTIASLTKRSEQLGAKRVTAQDVLDKAITARQQALLSGDLDDQHALDKLQGHVNTAAATLAALDDALIVLGHDKTEAERQLASERDRIERNAAADKLAKQVSAIEAALPGYLDQSRILSDALSEIAHWHFESGQMAGFVMNTTGQLEVAANFALAELKPKSEAIRQGRHAIPGEPAPVRVASVEATPETQTVFMLRSANYRDHEGHKRFAPQWEDVTLPLAAAHRALDNGIAAALTDPRRAQLRGMRGGDFNPRAPDVIDLDAIEEQKPVAHVPVSRAANFTVTDRSGENRTILIDVPRT